MAPPPLNRTWTTAPTVPKLRPAAAVRTNASLPASANMLLLGNEATGSSGFWIPPGDAAVSAGAWNVTNVDADTEQVPPGKKAVIDAVAVSIPQSVAAGVVPATVLAPVTVPPTVVVVSVPSLKIAGVPALVDVNWSAMGVPIGGKDVPPNVRPTGVGTSAGTVIDAGDVMVGEKKMKADATSAARDPPRGAVHRIETVTFAPGNPVQRANTGMRNVNDVPPAPTVPGTSIAFAPPPAN